MRIQPLPFLLLLPPIPKLLALAIDSSSILCRVGQPLLKSSPLFVTALTPNGGSGTVIRLSSGRELPEPGGESVGTNRKEKGL
jgi:hypothetical protein